jgi:hypothetical protein
MFLDERVGALAVLHHFLEIALEHLRQFIGLLASLVVQRRGLEHLVDQLKRQSRENVVEVERILDLVRGPRGAPHPRGRQPRT